MAPGTDPKSALVVYNTLTRSKEKFVPMSGDEVKMFVCGQTVYDDAHLGHAKNYINFDVIVRWMRKIGYRVNYIQNITDVDDKIIARANEKGQDPIELARHFEKRFLEDMESIGVKEDVSEYIRSHDYIDAIRDQIQLLIDNGYAYRLDEDVYYNVAKFHDYNKLSGMDMKEIGRHRIEVRPGKVNDYDFVLWKGAKPGEPQWKIGLVLDGQKVELSGRPGWHIEDTAMTASVFGPQYDVHGGASELIFPHHTNEIAQAEAAYGTKPFVKYWLHSGVLNIKGQKMSKSLSNFVKIRDFLKSSDAETLRLIFCSRHFRKEIDYTDEVARSAAKKLRYIYASLSRFYNMPESENPKSVEVTALVESFRAQFTDAMNDDFNTSLALSGIITLVNSLRAFAEANGAVEKSVKDDAIRAIIEYAGVFGILTKETYKEAIPDEAYAMIKKREVLRKERKFGESDEIRGQISEKFGIRIEDTEDGTVWYREGE
ncbi:MAG: cysteine--tRNA ligase [Candidatus Micrarchaeota archaeon]|nr:cysteine--tRNA ligase [Candidatus Micrarchaeota archaeon]